MRLNPILISFHLLGGLSTKTLRIDNLPHTLMLSPFVLPSGDSCSNEDVFTHLTLRVHLLFPKEIFLCVCVVNHQLIVFSFLFSFPDTASVLISWYILLGIWKVDFSSFCIKPRWTEAFNTNEKEHCLIFISYA